MFRAICQFVQFLNCAAQIRNFPFAQLFINCAKHHTICKLPFRGVSDNCVRKRGKRTLVVCTGVYVWPEKA